LLIFGIFTEMFLHKNVLKFSKHRFSENLKLFGRAFLIFLHRNVLKCRKMRFFRNFEIIRKNFFQNFEIFWFTAFRFFNSFSEFLMKNFWKTKKYELRRIADFDVYFYWIFFDVQFWWIKNLGRYYLVFRTLKKVLKIF